VNSRTRRTLNYILAEVTKIKEIRMRAIRGAIRKSQIFEAEDCM